jgi:hypothetical protein
MAINYSIVHSVISFEIVAPYTIRVHFEDHTSQVINFERVLGGELFRPLRDLDFFRQVYISEGIPTLTWSNGADFNPDHLHNWPDYEQLYADRASKWEKVRQAQHS